jgi:peptide/nickel transport system substrate-binding protein
MTTARELAVGRWLWPVQDRNAEFGVQLRLVRHDGWHLEGAYFDDLVMIVLNDPNARQTALVTGDVDASRSSS